MSALEMVQKIGLTGVIGMPNGIQVSVRVTDAKMSYGTPRYLVEPLAGSGEAWVNDYSIVFDAS